MTASYTRRYLAANAQKGEYLLAPTLDRWHDRAMNEQAPHPQPDPRAAALDLLQGVLHRKRDLDLEMATSAFTHLDGRNRAFVRNLVATTLRRLGQIDALIAGCLDRPLPTNARAAMDILRLGAAQLLFTGTANHAAIDTSVDLARARGQARLSALVNAVLRRLQREGEAARDAQDAERLNTPDWLWESWAEAYGPETCRAIAASHLAPAPLDITLREDAPGWAERLGGVALSDMTVRLPGGTPVPDLPGFSEGAWWVQDRAAALPARLLGPVAGKSILDLCAAPGGKTAQLAAAGARVTAVDRSAKRLETLAQNMARLNLSAEIRAADALTWSPDAPFDAILLDAPCSATGTIRRHPDLPRLKGPDDVVKLAALQEKLLARAADWLVPNGQLVFVTCSLQPQEGPERVRAFLSARNDFTCDRIEPSESGLSAEMISPEGWLRTLPSMEAEHGGMDGFFAARLRLIA